MNQRIKELAVQAGDDWDHTLESDKEFLKKFAELIVYECMDLALGSSHREDDMGAIIANKIRRHFGDEL